MNIILSIIWAFTDKIEKVYWINITEGALSVEEVEEIKKELLKQYGERFLLTFDNSGKGNSIKPLFFIKRK